MKNLLSLRKRTEQLTLSRLFVSDILPLFTIAGIILVINIGVIFLIGSAGRPGFAYDDGVQGMQLISFLNPLIIGGAALLLNRSFGLLTWVSAAISFLFFSRVHYDAIINGMLFGSILPQLIGVLCVLFLARAYEAIQLRRLSKDLVTIPVIIIYLGLAVVLTLSCLIHRQ